LTEDPTFRQVSLNRADKLEEVSMAAANDGLKALLLLNGGACIALIGFLASLVSSEHFSPAQVALASGAIRSLIWFSIGAGLAVFTSFSAYLSNQSYSSHLRNPTDNPKAWSTGNSYVRLGLVFALGSMLSFAIGVYKIWSTFG